MSDPEELVLLGGRVEPRHLLVDKEGVRDPDLVDVVRTNHQLARRTLQCFIRKIDKMFLVSSINLEY